MTLWIVRHACAGHKQDWSGDDDERPLDVAGHAQAAALAEELLASRPTRLLSSPTARCVQTLEPLAERLHLAIETDRNLCPQSASEGLLLLLERPTAEGVVVCSHGEAMKPVLDHLRRRGLSVDGDVADDQLLLKGTAWRLDLDEDHVRLRVHAPVPRADCPRHDHQE